MLVNGCAVLTVCVCMCAHAHADKHENAYVYTIHTMLLYLRVAGSLSSMDVRGSCWLFNNSEKQVSFAGAQVWIWPSPSSV